MIFRVTFRDIIIYKLEVLQLINNFSRYGVLLSIEIGNTSAFYLSFTFIFLFIFI